MTNVARFRRKIEPRSSRELLEIIEHVVYVLDRSRTKQLKNEVDRR